jgi:hypothetical protein
MKLATVLRATALSILAAACSSSAPAEPASAAPPAPRHVIALGERVLGAAPHEPLEVDPAALDTIGPDGLGSLRNAGAAPITVVTCAIEHGDASVLTCAGRSAAFDGGVARLRLPARDAIDAGESVDYAIRGMRATDASSAENLRIRFSAR